MHINMLVVVGVALDFATMKNWYDFVPCGNFWLTIDITNCGYAIKSLDTGCCQGIYVAMF